ncbi:ABC transporter ATP-binding protein [Candidatus Electronema sp. TJ]|uniref:ABC transporter ATP-binding protein n=1 Tax=Candidatus Electronema sp. TJ TaxID=3401573 RepID=UPI003AA9A2D9
MKSSQVTIKNVSKQFGDFVALSNTSLTIRKGGFYSLLGPSGCGKTTLLRIIGGFEMPSQGTVYFDDVDVLPLPPNKRHVNTIFQSYALFPHLTVFENVAFPLRLRKVAEAEIKRAVEENLTLVKMESESRKYPRQLSGGQKQRIAIARALINQPQVLLLDEPLSALDAKLRQHMLLELDAIHDKVGITFIYVTHDQAEALSVSDQVCVLNKGQIQQIGTPAEIYESPANEFVARFIGETNYIRGKVIAVTDEENAVFESPEYGKFNIWRDKKVQPGSSVALTVRPEKIRIAPGEPTNLPPDVNVLRGTVEDMIYTGFQTKYFVRVNGTKEPLLVFRQHVQYFMDEKPITWKDQVSVWWNTKDSFMVEVSQ